MYLGGYSTEEEAARAHDIMALKCRGLDSTLNYDRKDYAFLEDKLDSMSKVCCSPLYTEAALSPAMQECCC